MQVRIHLLGGFLLESEGRPLPPIPSSVGRSLFAYLAFYRDHRHTRDLLAGTFWPDHAETAARRRLSQALWQIQTALSEAGPPAGLIQGTTTDIAFTARSEDYWLDVNAFDDHLTRAASPAATSEHSKIADLGAAVSLYRGEFLAGFYDDWANVERERLRSSHLGALHDLTVLHKSRADYDTALSFARRLTLHDPLREQAHREVMRLCFLLGRSNEALHHYERCVEVLAVELGVEPALETRELRAQIVQLRDKGEHAFAPTIRSPLLDSERSIPIVGRYDERVAVLGRLEEALLGRGGVALIEGESGIGKSRLVQELVEDAQWRGLSPMRADCREETQLHPFEAMRTALTGGLTRLRVQQLGELLHGAVIADLARLVPVVREWLPATPPASALGVGLAREQLRYALRQTLLALAELSPHVIFIDDVQWADEESIAVLADLAPELQAHGLMICLTYRGAEARGRIALWDRLVAIDAASHAERMELRALSLSESTQLIEESLGTTAIQPHIVEGLFYETGGNPLFLLETLRAWTNETRGDLDTAGSLTTPSGEIQFPVSGGVAQVIARRLAGLAPQAQAMLDALAVLGRVTDPVMPAAVCGLSGIEALDGLDRLISRGIIVDSEPGYEFAHQQIRRVALDAIDTPRLRELHHAAGTFLENQVPKRVEELARHFSLAGQPAKAYAYSMASGKKAKALGAFETAAQHYERAAAELDEPDDPLELYTLWESVLDVLGRRADQHKVLNRLEDYAFTPLVNAEVASRRARLLTHEGNHKSAIALANQAIDEIGEEGTSVARGRTVQTLGFALRQSGRNIEAIPQLESAVASFSGHEREEAAARVDLGIVLCEVQRYALAVEHFRAALTSYEEGGDLLGMATTYGELAVARMEQGEGDLAIELYHKALGYCADSGFRRGEAVNLTNLANALYHQGSIAAALERYDQASAVFAAIGDRRTHALVAANAASVRYAILGDETVGSTLRGALEFFASEEHRWGEAFCHEHLAAIAHRRGDPDLARQHVAIGLNLVAESGHRWVEVHLRRLAAQIELDEGELDAAGGLAESALAMCHELGLSDITPTVESVLGMVLLMAGDVAGALERLHRATALLESGSERPYVVWFSLYLAAERAGQEEQARNALAEAVRLLDGVIDGLAPETRERARTKVPEHRVILEARARMFAFTKPVQLPKADVRLGRQLLPDDWIEVHWTMTDPSDFAIVSLWERRRVQLLRFLTEAKEQGGVPRMEDLATALNVSVTTVRRDLAALRSDGHFVVTRGGR